MTKISSILWGGLRQRVIRYYRYRCGSIITTKIKNIYRCLFLLKLRDLTLIISKIGYIEL